MFTKRKKFAKIKNMKKIFAFLLACLTVLVFAPATAHALDNTENTHLFGPTAVCATDDRVFVADNNNGNNLLYIFDSQGYTTKNLASVATKLDFANEKVFALLQDKIVVFDLQNNTAKTVMNEADVPMQSITNIKSTD